MKIVVLNGSPKGKNSITLKYVEYAQKMLQEDIEWEIIHISQQIHLLEKRPEKIREIALKVQSADGVLWAFPVYVYMVPSAVKRFIEIINEKELNTLFCNKYTCVLSTSIHFYDQVAHEYLHGILDDWNMKFTGCYSADMNDLLKTEERQKLILFFQQFICNIQEQRYTIKEFYPTTFIPTEYQPVQPIQKQELNGKKVLIITDQQNNSNLQKMVMYLTDSLKNSDIHILNLNEINMLGGCLGCVKCALDNQCAYEDKDDIKHIYEEIIPAADIVIYAGNIVDRYFSSRWKMFIERRFMKTHQPLLKGKQLAILVSGPLSKLSHLKTFFHAEAEISEANLCGIVSDEHVECLDSALSQLAEKLKNCSEKQYIAPHTFLGVGGQKVFRDEIWGKLRFIFQGDHKYFKSHGYYDFPQNNYKERLKNLFMMILLSIPKVRQKTRQEMVKLMIKPYEELLAKL